VNGDAAIISMQTDLVAYWQCEANFARTTHDAMWYVAVALVTGLAV